MIDWREYWDEFPRRFNDSDFRRQVGRTANRGVPTPALEIEAVIEEIVSSLALGPRDRLLDLCCGNGLLTVRLAERCTEAVGVDFSEPMIRLAREHHTGGNVRYVDGSVLDLGRCVDGKFDKICMVESLAYFGPDDLAQILDGLSTRGASRMTILFSGVLDDEAKWDFFDTPARRTEYEQQQKEGTEIMGRWWTRSEIGRIATKHGYETEFSSQDERLNTAHYRFNVLLRRA
jgi:cyclopropane fatty-acyl-phospholipid synthase-like methyltransferase